MLTNTNVTSWLNFLTGPKLLGVQIYSGAMVPPITLFILGLPERHHYHPMTVPPPRVVQSVADLTFMAAGNKGCHKKSMLF